MVDRALPKLGPTSSVNQLAGLDSGISPRGEALFTLPGTYEWIVPEGVLSVSAVTIGAGSASNVFISAGDGWGGAGGGLAWKNNISVSPGEIINVLVGEGGKGLAAASVTASMNGGLSQFKDAATCQATGGTLGASTSTGGTNTAGDGGGSGGDGVVDLAIAGNAGLSGSGAGGYTGDGGDGVIDAAGPSSGNAGTGGGGGSGGVSGFEMGGTGGGVGLYGEGDNGAAGTADATDAGGGGGGSGGADGDDVVGNITGLNRNGARYGGAAGASDGTSFGVVGDGADGAVRVIWGEDRFFPSTNVGRSE